MYDYWLEAKSNNAKAVGLIHLHKVIKIVVILLHFNEYYIKVKRTNIFEYHANQLFYESINLRASIA